MKFFIIALCITIVHSCWSSTPQKLSLRSSINLALDNAQRKQTYSDPGKNILKAADRACVNEKIKNNQEVKAGQAAFALTMVSFLCAPEEHHQKVFNYYAKNTISTGLSSDCMEVILKPISSHFSILKNSNPSKTDAQCESERSVNDKKIANDAKAMREQSNFEGCDDEFYTFATIEDYLFKYLEVKPASEGEIETTRNEFVKYYHDVSQRTVQCITG